MILSNFNQDLFQFRFLVHSNTFSQTNILRVTRSNRSAENRLDVFIKSCHWFSLLNWYERLSSLLKRRKGIVEFLSYHQAMSRPPHCRLRFYMYCLSTRHWLNQISNNRCEGFFFWGPRRGDPITRIPSRHHLRHVPRVVGDFSLNLYICKDDNHLLVAPHWHFIPLQRRKYTLFLLFSNPGPPGGCFNGHKMSQSLIGLE